MSWLREPLTSAVVSCTKKRTKKIWMLLQASFSSDHFHCLYSQQQQQQQKTFINVSGVFSIAANWGHTHKKEIMNVKMNRYILKS